MQKRNVSYLQKVNVKQGDSRFVKAIFMFSYWCFSITAMAQDIHYSQFNAAIQNVSPAQTGLFDGDWRLNGNFRSQWAAVPVPYKTFSIAADTRLKTKLQNDVPAAGLQINADQAGDSKFTTLQVLLSGAYIKKLSKDSTHFLSLAIQPGFTTRSFNLSALSFDSQYNGDDYDKSLSSQENFPKTRMTYLELGAGFSYLWRKSNRQLINIGFSALHLNTPRQSFFNENDIRLDRKVSISGLAAFPIAEKMDLLPTFLYQQQGKFTECVVGGFGKYYLKPVDGLTTAVSLGAFCRLKDAVVVAANMDYKNYTVGISYDINTSKLIAATNQRGGFELSVIYIFKKAVPFIAKKRVCPIFM
jgi:type IX secretion system PorP/SprF family membrane protein